MVTVLILFACFLLLADPGTANADPGVFRAIKVGGLSVAAVTAVVLVVFFVLAGHPAALGRAALRVERILPERLARLVARLAETFAEGLAAVRHPQHLAMVLLWSFPLWLSIAAGIWLVARAFAIEVTYLGSFLLMTLLVVGVAVPTPGAVGGFHEALPDRRDHLLPRAERPGGRRGDRPARGVVRAGHAAGDRLHGPGRADPGPHAEPGRTAGRGGGREVKCPYCDHLGDKVVDSRESKEGEVIRRRRECLDCGRRFTSYERIDEIPYMVVKKDGSRERFERQKLDRRHAQGVREAAGERVGAREGGRPCRGAPAGAPGEGDRDGGDRAHA